MLISNIKDSIKRAYHSMYYDCGGGTEDSCLVVGTARSGTTWIGDVVAAGLGARIIFEPFVPDSHNSLALSRMGSREMLVPGKDLAYLAEAGDGLSAELDRQILSVLLGSFRSAWTDKQVLPKLYRRRVIKEIRANYILGHIASKWPSLKIIHVIRDPMSVIDSMIEKKRKGWMFDFDVDLFERGTEFFEEWLSPRLGYIADRRTLPERLAIRWCLENSVALSQLEGRSNVCFVNYDELCSSPSNWKAVGCFLGDEAWLSVSASKVMVRPSITSDRGLPKRKQKRTGYLNLDDHDIYSISKIVHEFDLSSYMRS